MFDGAWATTEVFWWPFTGASIGDEPLPSVQRGWWNVPLEVIGLAIVVWVWRRPGCPTRRAGAPSPRTGEVVRASPVIH